MVALIYFEISPTLYQPCISLTCTYVWNGEKCTIKIISYYYYSKRRFFLSSESVLLAMASATRGGQLERSNIGPRQCGVRYLPGEADVT